MFEIDSVWTQTQSFRNCLNCKNKPLNPRMYYPYGALPVYIWTLDSKDLLFLDPRHSLHRVQQCWWTQVIRCSDQQGKFHKNHSLQSCFPANKCLLKHSLTQHSLSVRHWKNLYRHLQNFKRPDWVVQANLFVQPCFRNNQGRQTTFH